ncbi:helix-turn-helix domain-containing protein [Nocardioides marmoribigeumensis]
MRAELARTGGEVVVAIRSEVPEYADPFRGEMGRTIETAVTLALGGFLDLAASQPAGEGSFERVWDAAYALGRGEARSGRSMEALLSAYRVGARVAWRDLSRAAVSASVPAGAIASFAELVFDYIDELSAASAAGHADELARTGRVRLRYLERLAQALLRGDPATDLESHAHRAEWVVPDVLTAVVLPESRVRAALGQLDAATLQATEQVPDLEDLPDLTVLLVPGRAQDARAALVRGLADRGAVVGPTLPWSEARRSLERALRVVRLLGDADGAAARVATVDTEDHLDRLVLSADPAARQDLRTQVLAPLQDLRPAAADKLEETLRAWVRHQGRREDMAAELFVHPQTVRYRMGQLRELYAERLTDPDWVVRVTLAVGVE